MRLSDDHGAAVTAVCSGRSADFVRACGAAVVLDYTGDLLAQLAEEVREEPVCTSAGRKSFFV